jgi:hypothetical protein
MNFSTHHVHKLNGNLIDCQLRISTASFPLPYSGKALLKQDFASSQFLSFEQRSLRIYSFYCYVAVTEVSRNKRTERWQKNKTTEGSVVKTFPRGSLLSKYHTFSRVTCKCDCIYAYKKCKDVPAPIYIKVGNNVTCTTIFYAEFHPNWTTNMERSGRHSFAP